MIEETPILTQKEIAEFDNPPMFNDRQLEALFRLPDQAEAYLDTLRSATSKLSFIMQFAYCQVTSQFYSPSNYPNDHLRKVIRIRSSLRSLRSVKGKPKFDELKKALGGSTLNRHRAEIKQILGLSEVDLPAHRQFNEFAAEQAKKQMGPEIFLKTLVTELRCRKWIVPSITTLQQFVSSHYYSQEKEYCQIIDRRLPLEAKSMLIELLEDNKNGSYSLQQLKKIDQATTPRSLQYNSRIMTLLWAIYRECEPCIKALALTDQAVAYYSRWVSSTDIRNIRRIDDDNRLCLYLIGFVIHQIYDRQDAAAYGFNKKLTSYINKARKDSEKKRSKLAATQSNLLEESAKSRNEIVLELRNIVEVGQDDSLSISIRLTKVLTGLIDLIDDNEEKIKKEAEKINTTVESVKTKTLVYESLLDNFESISRALSSTLKVIIFDKHGSEKNLYNAVRAFQLGKGMQTSFLTTPQRKLLDHKPQQQAKLYRLFLFEAVMAGLKSDSLNLKYAFVWRSLDSLLKGDGENWQSKLKRWLDVHGLGHLRDFDQVRKQLTEEQDRIIKEVNDNYDANRNPYLTLQENGKFKLKKMDKDSDEENTNTISELLYEVEKLSVKDVLETIQRCSDFMQQFVHAKNRFVNRDVDETYLLAAIIALGCNIGPREMIKSSDGISHSQLMTTIEERMTPVNLRRAIDALAQEIGKLSLSDVFQFDPLVLHSSSDGQKLHIDGESLLASRSFKYFGSESGLTRYPFIDERQRNLNLFVFSAAIREATYMLDGFVGNLGNMSRMHSTDTHGYTDAVFGLSWLKGIDFAPRIRGIEKLGLYGARSNTHYKKYGYDIRPSSAIRWSLIEKHWDQILRVIVTIVSGHASASQIMQRLNSYSKNSLYAALKEFGRLPKTNFVLRYINDDVLRQRIQKQLNLSEKANSFFKAVFWARGHRLRINRPGDEERYLLSAQLIQNAIVLWNYYYVSDLLMRMPGEDERQALVEQIQKGQMLAWRHISFSGEFSFEPQESPNYMFDVASLRKLRVSRVDVPRAA